MRKIRVGVDFDGVLAYNPFRVARLLVSTLKRKVLRIEKLSFFIPRNGFERLIWAIMHESSVFPAIGADNLKSMAGENKYEFYLVTARFGFLAPQLSRWLRRWGFDHLFRALEINHAHEQPHLFKARIIRNLKLDYYIEDNWDIVDYLVQTNTKSKIFWIYNVLDRSRAYPHKFPYLGKALELIRENSK